MIHYAKALVGAFQIQVARFADREVSWVEVAHEEGSFRIDRAADGGFDLAGPPRARASSQRVAALLGAVRTLVAWRVVDTSKIEDEALAETRAAIAASLARPAEGGPAPGHANGFTLSPDVPLGAAAGPVAAAPGAAPAAAAPAPDEAALRRAAELTAALPEFNPPPLKVGVGFVDGRTPLVILFAREEPRFPVVACHVVGRPAIFLVSRYAPLDLRVLPEDLREDRLIEIDPEDLREVGVRRNGLEIHLRRHRTGRWTSDPAGVAGGRSLAQQVERIVSLRALRTVEGELAAPFEGVLEKPVATLEIVGEDARHTSIVLARGAGAGGAAIARVAGLPRLYVVPREEVDALVAALDSVAAGRVTGTIVAGDFGAAGRFIPDDAEGAAAGLLIDDPERVPAPAQVDAVKVSYDLDFEKIRRELSCSFHTLRQIQTTLAAGRNVILYGAPGVGKTKLLTLLCDQLCGTMRDAGGKVRRNYTIVTANAEWSSFDVIGGLQPVLDPVAKAVTYRFKYGCISDGAQKCARSVVATGKPHYVVVDEFNRANIDETFGRLLTVFEYRKEQPLLTPSETGNEPFFLPPQFRLIGTMNVEDKNSLFTLGYALMRRFAFIEVGLPDADDELRRLPFFAQERLVAIGALAAADLERARLEFESAPPEAIFPFVGAGGEELRACYDLLMRFIERESLPDASERVARGIRTYKSIGPAQLIDCIAAVAVARGANGGDDGAARRQALEDQIVANILPQLEGLDKVALVNMKLKAEQVFGEDGRVTRTLDRILKSPSLSVFG